MTNEKFYLSKRAFEAPPIESYEMPIGEMFPMPKGWSLNPRHDYPFEIQYRWIRVGDRILSREGSFTGPVITIHTEINTINSSIDTLVLSSMDIDGLEKIGYRKTIDEVKLRHYEKHIHKYELQDLVDAYYDEMKLLENVNIHKIYMNEYKKWKRTNILHQEETTASFNISKRAEEDLRTLFPLSMFSGMKESRVSWNITAYQPNWIEARILEPTNKSDIPAKDEIAGFYIKKDVGDKYFVSIVWAADLQVPLNDVVEREKWIKRELKSARFKMSFEQVKHNIGLIADVIASITMGVEKHQKEQPHSRLVKLFPFYLFNRWDVDYYHNDYIQARLSVWKNGREEYWSFGAKDDMAGITAHFHYHKEEAGGGPRHYTEIKNAKPDDPRFEKMRKMIEDANHKGLEHMIQRKESFEISKRAQLGTDQAKRTAASLFKIVQFLFHRVPPQEKLKFYNRLKGKVIRLSPGVIGTKRMPASAAIGQSINMAKNLLAGLNPLFVRQVLLEFTHLLSNIGLNQLR